MPYLEVCARLSPCDKARSREARHLRLRFAAGRLLPQAERLSHGGVLATRHTYAPRRDSLVVRYDLHGLLSVAQLEVAPRIPGSGDAVVLTVRDAPVADRLIRTIIATTIMVVPSTPLASPRQICSLA